MGGPQQKRHCCAQQLLWQPHFQLLSIAVADKLMPEGLHETIGVVEGGCRETHDCRCRWRLCGSDGVCVAQMGFQA